jgi:Na+/phosphate symporter
MEQTIQRIQRQIEKYGNKISKGDLTPTEVAIVQIRIDTLQKMIDDLRE